MKRMDLDKSRGDGNMIMDHDRELRGSSWVSIARSRDWK